jgi:hypothetical protein
MKRYLIIGALVLAVIAMACLPALAQKSLGPSLVLKETKFESGKIREGKSIEHTFKVFNKGDKDLIIGNVKPG